MANQISYPASTSLRRKQVEVETGYSCPTIYLRIQQKLWPKPIALGVRAVGWPAREVFALNAARIAGVPDEAIRQLVGDLEIGSRGSSSREGLVGRENGRFTIHGRNTCSLDQRYGRRS